MNVYTDQVNKLATINKQIELLKADKVPLSNEQDIIPLRYILNRVKLSKLKCIRREFWRVMN